jgi:transposase, IS5 family
VPSYPLKRISLADGEFATKKKLARRECFLAEMEQVVQWVALLAVLAPHDRPGKAEGRLGHPPIGLKRDAAASS